MKRQTILLCTTTLLFFACNNAGDDNKNKMDSTTTTTTTTSTEVKKEVSPIAMPDSATRMKNWQMCMTPGDMQKMMASWDGTWNSEVTMWQKPDAPPQKSMGTTVNKMVLGGRYQESVNTSTMMGMPFEGHGTLGYNNANNMFESSWIDNMGTGVMHMKGPWDAATKSVTLRGKETDPETMTEKDFKETFKVVDNNTQMMEMYGPGMDGKEIKMMEIKFTRKK